MGGLRLVVEPVADHLLEADGHADPDEEEGGREGVDPVVVPDGLVEDLTALPEPSLIFSFLSIIM